MTEPLRVGIVGCGVIYPLHLEGYRRTHDARIVALCDADDELLARRAAELGGDVKTYANYYEGLLADEEIDAIEILTPHDLHLPMAAAACEAGKHVSVQKPMGRTPSEVREMRDAAAKAGVQIRCFEAYVFYPPIVKAKQLIDAGAIGDVTMVRVRSTTGALECSWPLTGEAYVWRVDTDTSGGGVMFDDMHHKYATALYLGGDVTSVFAYMPNRGSYLDFPAAVAWQYAAPNRLGVMDCADAPNMWLDTDYYSIEERVEITGSDGIIWVTRCTGALYDTPGVVLHTGRETRTFNDVPHDWADGFAGATLDFINAIRTDRAPRLACDDAIKVLQFALAAYRSVDEGRPVDPQEIDPP